MSRILRWLTPQMDHNNNATARKKKRPGIGAGRRERDALGSRLRSSTRCFSCMETEEKIGNTSKG